MASKLVPDYEVKLLLNTAEVLDSYNELKDDVRITFSTKSNAKEMSIQFVDNTERTIYINGWNLRIRKTEGDNKFELTYKKRYPIIDGEFSNATINANIDTALETAKQDGFASTAPYGAQIEVGYRKQTLSISHDVNASDDGSEGTNLPLIDKSRQFLADNAPDKFKEWAASNLGSDQLTDSMVYGPTGTCKAVQR